WIYCISIQMTLMIFDSRFCFFFSSRRRHTRSKRDWSSDVCSSDLPPFSLHLQVMKSILFIKSRCKLPPLINVYCLLVKWLWIAISHLPVGSVVVPPQLLRESNLLISAVG